MHLHSLVLLPFFLDGDARRSIRIDDSHNDTEQQDELPESAVIKSPIFRRKPPSPPDRDTGSLYAYRASPWFRFGPHPEQDQLPPKDGKQSNKQAKPWFRFGPRPEQDHLPPKDGEQSGERAKPWFRFGPRPEQDHLPPEDGEQSSERARPWFRFGPRPEQDHLPPEVSGTSKHVMGNPNGHKICVLGGAGSIGQPLSMFMAMDPNVREVAVYDLDIAAVPPGGVATDLDHIESAAFVTGHVGKVGRPSQKYTRTALSGCSLVLIPAGMARKPGMTRDDLFMINADITKGLVQCCARYCPNATVALIVNPINSIVPAMAELYRKKGLDPKKIVGVTTLDCVRANKFVSQVTGAHPSTIQVPVVGGHEGKTILPIFSQDEVAATIWKNDIPALDKRVQDAGTEVVNAKAGKGSVMFSMAYAGARLSSCILSGMSGQECTECAYVQSDVTDLPYFSSRVVFGKHGVKKVLPLGNLTDYEKQRLAEASAALKMEIDTGLKYAKANRL